MENKKKKAVQYMQKRLRSIISKNTRSGNYETALEAIATYSEIICKWNQCYAEEYLERALLHVQKNILKTSFKKEDTDEKTILFYDGVAHDTRGLMLIYINALLALGYRVIYVITAAAKGKQPALTKMVENKNFVWEYLSFPQKYIYLMQELNELFLKYKPARAFCYALSYNIVGPAVFSHYKGIVERYYINLTDVTCFFGIHALDYCLEFSDYAANISYAYRGIEKEKIIKIPYYPYIDDTLPFEGFPFQSDGYKVVFSGGNLYKTLDTENTFYQLIRSILEYDDTVIFLYAGSGRDGEDLELNKLIEEYPGRAWHIQERKDLYQLLQHTYFFLNTYPIMGGLMVQYAAMAGKVPVSIGNDDGMEDILSNQGGCQYLFDNVEEALQEIYRLLDNREYAEQKGQMCRQCMMEEKKFVDALKMALIEHTSPYDIQEDIVEVERYTQKYLKMFTLQELRDIVIKDEHWELRNRFPLLFFRKRARNLMNLIKHMISH